MSFFPPVRDKDWFIYKLLLGFDIANSLLGILTDSKDSYMLQCNKGIRDLLNVIQPLNLMYMKRSDAILQMAFTAIHFGKKTSGEVAAPVTFFKGSSCILSHLSHPPL